MKKILLTLALTSIFACQAQDNLAADNPAPTNHTMTEEADILSNETVAGAINALEDNDKSLWYSYFTEDVTFTDDAKTMDFKAFFDNAFAQKEKFLSIDSVENNGKDIVGDFYAGRWGTFKVFFKFHINEAGKIYQLDIGRLQ